MSGSPRTILFLNHSATRNGASILLLHLLQWLRSNSDFRLEVLVSDNGPLIDEFRSVARIRRWRNPAYFLPALKFKWAQALGSRLEDALLRAYLRRHRFDLVYANTAATWSQVAALGLSERTVLWHIHELPYALRLTMGDERARRLLPRAARVVAVSEPVQDALTDQFAVDRHRIDLVHGFVPTRDPSAQQRQSTRRRILAELGWPADSFVVGACGNLGWRKGSDVFLQIAHRLQKAGANPGVRFLWIGGGDAGGDALQFDYDRRALGLESACRRIASTADVDDYYCAMDVFALPSREDPFPLVMLEAAMHRLPTICYAASGGGPVFVGGDAGIVVPYLDSDSFAAAIAALQADPARRTALGLAARRKVCLHHSVETQGPKLLRSIERCLATT
jgi:glycosyltransferase involved in cell wall biosynthesis